MMNLFRRGGGGQWIVAAVASVIIVVFVVEFRTGRGPAKSPIGEECAIKVQGTCTSRKEFHAAYGLIAHQGIPAKQIKAMKLPEMVVDGLVERELLVAEAQKLGVGVGDDDLDVELTQGRAHVSLPVAAADALGFRLGLCVPDPMTYTCAANAPLFRLLPVKRAQDKKFDSKIYERVIRTYTNRGPKQFREMQEREMTAARMRELVRSRVRVAREEAWQLFERHASTVTAKYVALDRDWFARYAIDLSPASVDAWAAQHKDQIEDGIKRDKERFSAGCTLVSEIAFQFGPETTDAEKVQLRTKADNALQRIQKDHESFETVARQTGVGETALAGGSLGCLNESYGTGAKELMDEADKLKDHEVSHVIESPRGFHILRRDGKLAEAELDATVRHASARRLALRFLADEAMQKFATQLAEKVKSGVEFEVATNALSAELTARGAKVKAGDSAVAAALVDLAKPKVTTSMPFSADETPGPEFLPFSGIGAKLFALEKPGQVLSEPVPTRQGIAVLSLLAKKEASREEFEKEAPQIMQRLQEQKARDALVEYVAGLHKQAAATIKVDDDLRNLKIRGSDE
ncbi:MAG TPA: SurA N-terminal domain-containing protein [Polyangiaceae bacterium]|nr:SurA N-terminal domain-containing protein [Polyangiaceae bacterium]